MTIDSNEELVEREERVRPRMIDGKSTQEFVGRRYCLEMEVESLGYFDEQEVEMIEVRESMFELDDEIDEDGLYLDDEWLMPGVDGRDGLRVPSEDELFDDRLDELME